MSYLELKPDKVGFFDLVKILISTDLEKRKFVDSSEKTEESFRHRWLIFGSIVVQKLLLLISMPLSFFGSVTEFSLNLLSSNDNIVVLLVNLFRGKVVVPDKSSANYLSLNGHLDKRLKMDDSIKPGDARYLPQLSIMASKLSYENRTCIETVVHDFWKMEYLGFYDYWNDYQDKATTQVMMVRDKNSEHDILVVAFRGTECFDADAWCSDFDISGYELPCFGRVHGGFMKALGLKENEGLPRDVTQQDQGLPPLAYYDVREKLKTFLSENKDAKYIITGHSLGGALAILFPAALAYHEEHWLLERLEGVYTFGQPRVGDQRFGEVLMNKFKEHHVNYLRFVYGNDIVPRLPFDNKTMLFKHFGTCIFYDRNYQGKKVAEQPNKNYFSPMGMISMTFDAFLELVRSFTIAHKRGSEYQEGNFLRFFRVIGLLAPGVPSHAPQDYVNSIRLSSPDLFSKTL